MGKWNTAFWWDALTFSWKDLEAPALDIHSKVINITIKCMHKTAYKCTTIEFWNWNSISVYQNTLGLLIKFPLKIRDYLDRNAIQYYCMCENRVGYKVSTFNICTMLIKKCTLINFKHSNAHFRLLEQHGSCFVHVCIGKVCEMTVVAGFGFGR